MKVKFSPHASYRGGAQDVAARKMPAEVLDAHEHSVNHRKEIAVSKVCGCFACTNIFPPSKIWEWIETDTDEFAMCPYCGIDAVIGDESGYTITRDFLSQMNRYWFDGDLFAEAKA